VLKIGFFNSGGRQVSPEPEQDARRLTV